ncbi:Metallo-dependent phosphatase-like protein [Glomus cerebriforme]|uniref:Metallo-dependent phosphatase-like protein n=1 Tax=Glomus cerebriforme TaxID=658196 RepID=A0A397SPU3_9GLOM|nr:Metallo-dependent phosphatase-like protein [Glomus cerebriforme]
MLRGISGPWGAPATVCDSPLNLIDATFDWLEKNWKNKLDFIIWTGDNSRHDNDENIPRTPTELFKLNKFITEKFLKTFSNMREQAPHFIPIIPSIGNNDIYPNNIIGAGPNELLSIIHDIWSPFIPKGQHKTFLDGGYYYKEVIPGKLIVVSLNTLYFYNSNTAVNGCKEEGQPGTIEMKWLNDVLKKAYKLGMKVYLTGHVAPRAKQYTKSCYKQYGRLSLKYQDIILGHYYGHSNMDHFFFITANGVKKGHPLDDDNEVLSLDDDDLYEEEEEIVDDDDDDETVEDQEKQINENENGKIVTKVKNIKKYMKKLLNHYRTLPPLTDDVVKDYAVVHINPSIIPTFFPALRIFKYNTTEVTNRNTNAISDLDAPSRKNTFLTPLGYTQYFINLTHANLYPNVTPEFTVEYTTWDDYFLKDLTIPSWIQLARKIVNDGLTGLNSALWEKIQEHLLVGTRDLINRKSQSSYQQCIYSKCRAKGPEDYIASELSF